MKLDVSELKGFGDHVFEGHSVVMSLYQTLAEHFYPERADFTITRNQGHELADNLVDSYPVLVRRDLGNSFSSMLRDGNWFDMGVNADPDHAGTMWLQQSTTKLRRLFNDRLSNFVRATKESDHDYATFGNSVISIERNRKNPGLLFRCWHLRDCAWFDDETGQVGGVVRNWKPTYRELVNYFGENKVDGHIIDELHKTPFKRANIRHFVIPSNIYGDEQIEARFPFVSIFLDIDHEMVIEEFGQKNNMYVVPRFQTIAGSPYAYSPATVVGLPDARTLQAMTHTLLEAGERYARPPIIATQKVIRGDVDLAPDGITWVDDEYDERMGAALRPMAQDRGGFPIGMELREGITDVLASAFYINKLTLPDINREMTAYEVSERMKQYRRENLPLFSPIESEYNGQMCELAFQISMDTGLLGSPYDIPQSLREREIEFKFTSPLTQSEEEEKATRFQQTSAMLAEAAQFDQGVSANFNFDIAVRDAITGIGAPAKWLNPMSQVIEMRKAQGMQQVGEMAASMGVEMPEGEQQ